MDDITDSELIEMAWDDKTSFDMIEQLTGLPEKAVKTRMRHVLKPSSYKLWRKRVTGRALKHSKKKHQINQLILDQKNAYDTQNF